VLLHLEPSDQHTIQFPFTCIGLRLCAAFTAQLVKDEVTYAISQDITIISVTVTGGY